MTTPRKCSLLVVADEPSLLLTIVAMLARDFEVITADSAEAAMRVLAHRKVDIILANQKLPRMTGVQLLEWVRQHSPRTVRLLMTGYSEIEEAIDAINRGHVYHYLLKPWRTEELRQVLRNAADKLRLGRNREQLLEELCRLNQGLERRVAERTRELEKINHLLQQRSRELEMLALTDPLTGLLNRRAVDDAGRAEVKRHQHNRELLEMAAMYERFTDRARKVMQLANQEAQRFNHEYIGTEHILLGLVKEGSGVAANVLQSLNIDLRKIRLEVEKIVQTGPDMVRMGKLPQTPLAKKVIECAIEESHNLNHHYVGTEHLLLGLLLVREGVAAQVLINLGLKLEDVREEVLLRLLKRGRPGSWTAAPHLPPAEPEVGRLANDLCRLERSLEQLAGQVFRLNREMEKRVPERSQEPAPGDAPSGELVRPTGRRGERPTHGLFLLEALKLVLSLALMLSLAITVPVWALLAALWLSTPESGFPVWWVLPAGIVIGVFFGLAWRGNPRWKGWDYIFDSEVPGEGGSPNA